MQIVVAVRAIAEMPRVAISTPFILLIRSTKILSRILFLAWPVCALPALVLWSKLPDDEIAQFLAIALR